MTDTTRTPTDVDALADRYVLRSAALDPLLATQLGLPGHDHELPDLSPGGIAARADHDRATLAALEALEPADGVDRVTVAAMRERLGVQVELAEAGELTRDLNVIASPVQTLRDVFDLMPTATVEDWEVVAARLAALPTALEGYQESLRAALRAGDVAAVRQVEACIKQADGLADADTSFFTSFVASAEPGGETPPRALRAALEAGARDARQAYADLARMLGAEIAPDAARADAVGRDRYALWSRYFLGAVVDLDETYEWGLAELERVVAEEQAVADELYGAGTDIAEARRRLDADPARTLVGTEALREWMQTTSDAAVEALSSQFDIPEPVRRLECLIAPTQSGGIYYTGPSADFSRPGRMWWSVPAGVTEFSTWQEKTTVYHEGVPGHHLQVGQTVYRSGLLNTWRRMASWVSGHGEGWALYAERLMADLGHLDEPGDRLGMLDGQRLRSARVVVDIGVHLGKPAPERWGGGTWDAAKAWPFLQASSSMPDGFLAFELDRYLGWPGQAPSYKIGQRLWEEIRDASRAAAQARGEAFDLRAFHRRALDVGSVGLDVLRDALL